METDADVRVPAALMCAVGPRDLGTFSRRFLAQHCRHRSRVGELNESEHVSVKPWSPPDRDRALECITRRLCGGESREQPFRINRRVRRGWQECPFYSHTNERRWHSGSNDRFEQNRFENP